MATPMGEGPWGRTAGDDSEEPLGEGLGRIPGIGARGELRVVDLGLMRRSQLPPWIVRRAARIIMDHRSHLDLEELADIAIAMMREADARLSGRGGHITR